MFQLEESFQLSNPTPPPVETAAHFRRDLDPARNQQDMTQCSYAPVFLLSRH